MQSAHFVGIGGYGMSALAEVLHSAGWRVTGSDAKPSSRTRRLQEVGVPVQIGHRPENVGPVEAVVYSTDVPEDNPELQAARERGLPILHRSEVLAGLINPRLGVAVTGTHGKTTTTAMIATICDRCGLDPVVLLGGELPAFGGTARFGRGQHVIAEADESDGSFLRYAPYVAVITNVEAEHLEKWGGSFERVVDAMRQFVHQVKPGGLAVLCGDDPRLAEIASRAAVPVRTYGLTPDCEVVARDLRREPTGGWSFEVELSGATLGRVRVPLEGRHNVSNALAAIAATLHLGLPFQQVADALAQFANAKRRFQVIAQAGGIRVVDDYAHHPSEIRATLQAARDGLPPGGRVLAVFQPQRYTRTFHLLDQFATCFGGADALILTEIYSPPGERPIPGVSSAALADRIERADGRRPEVLDDKERIARRLLELARPGDTVLTMGAGDVWQVAELVAERLRF